MHARPWGVRPLALGKTSQGQWCVASETCAFDAIDAQFIREIEPGEIVRIDDTGVSSRHFDKPAEEQAHCAFEHVYFANPASKVFGQTVHTVREKMGRQLAREVPVIADYVMPMPDSGRSAALGYAKESCIQFEEGIVPNRFVGRTFILPNQIQRDRAVGMKLNIIPDVVDGKRIVIVEDSVVRGTTTQSKMRAIRRATRERDSSARQLPADSESVFLRDRLSDQQGTDRPQSHGRSDSRISGSGQPCVSVARWNARLPEACAEYLLHRLLERKVQDSD